MPRSRTNKPAAHATQRLQDLVSFFKANKKRPLRFAEIAVGVGYAQLNPLLRKDVKSLVSRKIIRANVLKRGIAIYEVSGDPSRLQSSRNQRRVVRFDKKATATKGANNTQSVQKMKVVQIPVREPVVGTQKEEAIVAVYNFLLDHTGNTPVLELLKWLNN